MIETTSANEPIPQRNRWQFHWTHLFEEVVSTNICTGCSGCVLVCPHGVLGYDDNWHPFLQQEAQVDCSPSRCVHGEKACTMCTRACPRFRSWEPEIDEHLWGRQRNPDDWHEIIGVHKKILLARATDSSYRQAGQDGGLCSAVLAYCIDADYIDSALVSYADSDWRTEPGVARCQQDVLQAAGSRYTYSPNLQAYANAINSASSKIALVGMGCMTSVPPIMAVRGARKHAKRFALNIGLLCSKSFTDRIFEDLLEREYGIKRADITKMNIKGKLQLWLRPGVVEGDYVEVPLSKCRDFTRPGCTTCPDFTAEHADISMGGLGQSGGWTLTIVRTDLGSQIIDEMEAKGEIEQKHAADADPQAVELMRKLAGRSRKRWPVTPESDRPEGQSRPGLAPSAPSAPQI